MGDLDGVAERVWYGDGAAARVARAALSPLSLLYGAVVQVRAALYDRGALPSFALALPTVSVGNLSVGGTGKTPVAAWLAGELARRGERPAVVLRGYGADEPLVHERLTPTAIVVADPDRVRGVARARALGATVAVLDDAFQHRRARRDVDVVLVSADRWTEHPRLLPAGDFREPLAALCRATAVVVTRKAASSDVAARAARAVAAHAPGVPCAVVHLAPGDVHEWTTAAVRPHDALRDRAVLAISAIGDPRAFEAQLSLLGARVLPRRFGDHHPFTAADAGALAADAATHGGVPLCTLKDAVKLGPLWPRAAHPLWYLSQRVNVERGADELARAIGAALRSPTD